MGGKTLKAVEAFNSTKKENEAQPARYYNILVFLVLVLVQRMNWNWENLKKIIPVDNHFITVVVPDFNEKKSVLNVSCKYILFLFSLGCCVEILWNADIIISLYNDCWVYITQTFLIYKVKK